MAKPKRESYVIKSGNETILFEATPHEAARKVVREARGTFDKTKRHYEQPENAHPPRKAVLVDDKGSVLMTCLPSLYGRYGRGRPARSTVAQCDVKPAFKRRIKRKRR